MSKEEVEKTKQMITRMFEPNTKLWLDYSRAKRLIQNGFTLKEYEELINFIAGYLGV
jgi:ribosomal protein S17E